MIVGTARGQSHQSQHQSPTKVFLEPEEEQQVQKFVQEFTKRLQETRDVSPLMDEFFIGDFKKLLTQDGWWAGLIGLPFPLARQLDENERYRLYVTQFSLEYLFKIYYASKVPLTDEALKSWAALLPPKVNGYLNASNPPTGEITTSKEARRFLAILENTLTLMLEEIVTNPPEKSEQFKKNSAAFSLHLQEPGNAWGRPFVTTLSRDLLSYPEGTRLIKLEIPFHNALSIVKVNGRFKVLFATTMIPPD